MESSTWLFGQDKELLPLRALDNKWSGVCPPGQVDTRVASSQSSERKQMDILSTWSQVED